MIRPRFFSLLVFSLALVGFVAINLVPESQIRADESKAETVAVEVETEGDVAVPVLGAVDGAAEAAEPYQKPDEKELRKRLSRLQFDVTQKEKTEPAHRNKYWNNKSSGTYECIVCGQDLFTSETKYKSGTGWPSFFKPLNESKVGYKTDNYLFYSRTEVHCSRCEAHLGHVFDDGPKPTGKRYCMNSAAMNFVEESAEPKDEAVPKSK